MDLFVKELSFKGFEVETRTASFVASTEIQDADGDIVEQSWRLERYKRNPVVLFAHDNRSLPIGRASEVEVKDGQLVADITFASAEANPLAENVWKSVQEGTLRAVSVGFRPHQIKSERRDDKDVYLLGDNELYEISVVPIPSNPEALARMKALAIEIVTEAAVPYQAHKPVDGGRWSGSTAEKSIKAWATTDGTIDWAKYRKGFAWYDAAAKDKQGSYKLVHHMVQDGDLVTVRGGVIAAGGAVSGSRGGVDIPEGDVAAVKAHLAKHYKQFDLTPPWEQDNKTANGGMEKEMDIEETEKELNVEKAKVIALQERCATLDKALADERAKVKAYEIKEVEGQVDALIGTKIAPTEKAGLLKLAGLDRGLFDEQLEAITDRPDMHHMKTVVGPDPNPNSLPAAVGDNGAGFEALVGQIG